MVAAEDEREAASGGRRLDLARQRAARVPDRGEVFRLRVARLDELLRLYRDGRLEAGRAVAQRLQTTSQARETNGRRPHVGTVAAGAEVKRHFKDVDVHGGADNQITDKENR